MCLFVCLFVCEFVCVCLFVCLFVCLLVVLVVVWDAVECVCMDTQHHACRQLPANSKRADLETWACACPGNHPTPVLR